MDSPHETNTAQSDRITARNTARFIGWVYIDATAYKITS